MEGQARGGCFCSFPKGAALECLGAACAPALALLSLRESKTAAKNFFSSRVVAAAASNPYISRSCVLYAFLPD